MNEVIEAGRAACCTHRHGRCCRGAIRCDGRETAGVHRNSYRSELRPELQQEFCSCVQLRRSCGAAVIPWLYASGTGNLHAPGAGYPPTQQCGAMWRFLSCAAALVILVARWRGRSVARRPEGRTARRVGVRICYVLGEAASGPAMANVYLEHLRALMRRLRGSDITVLLLAPASTKIRASIDTLAATVERGQGSVRAAQLAISWHRYEGSRLAVLSHRVYDWLQSQPAFEIVVFGGAGGAAYYSLVARAQGLALSGARVALVESLTRRLELDRRVGSGVSLLELEEDYMQRSASSLADALFVSAAALRSMQARAWRLPLLVELWGVLDGSHAAWGGAPRRRPGAPPEADSSRRGSTGRCDAACCGQACASPPVRLLLRWSLDYVHRNAHSFGTRVLAVAPSSDTPDTTTPAAEAAIRPGIVWSPLGVHEPCAHESCAHRSRDRKVGGDGGAVAAGVRSTLHAPLVSVCVVHHDRGELLQQALQSVRGQTLEPGLVQVVLVDDGSTSTEALAALAAIDAWEEFSSGRWLLLRRPSRYLGAARNEAARHAVAPFLVFLDDDNFLKPHALATLARSAELSHAHILTMVNEKWPRAAAPPNADASSERWLPLGGAAVVRGERGRGGRRGGGGVERAQVSSLLAGGRVPQLLR